MSGFFIVSRWGAKFPDAFEVCVPDEVKCLYNPSKKKPAQKFNIRHKVAENSLYNRFLLPKLHDKYASQYKGLDMLIQYGEQYAKMYNQWMQQTTPEGFRGFYDDHIAIFNLPRPDHIALDGQVHNAANSFSLLTISSLWASLSKAQITEIVHDGESTDKPKPLQQFFIEITDALVRSLSTEARLQLCQKLNEQHQKWAQSHSQDSLTASDMLALMGVCADTLLVTLKESDCFSQFAIEQQECLQEGIEVIIQYCKPQPRPRLK